MNSRKLQFGTCKLWHNHRQVRKTKERTFFFFLQRKGEVWKSCPLKETGSSKCSDFSSVRL